MKKTVTSFPIILLTTVTITGCSLSANTDTSEETKDSLTMSWPQDIGELDPHSYAPNEMFAQNLVYDSLVLYDKDGEIQPHLAKEWEVADDGKEYIFTLRDDVVFSDNTVFNAEIVKKNFDHVLAEKEDHSWLELVNQIEDTKVIDERTFSISLKNPYYPLLQELALVRPFRFLGASGFNENGAGIDEPIGTGAWVLKEYRQNDRAVFERNENYWGEKPDFEELIVKVIPDNETRVIEFENESIDLIYGNGLISLDAYEYIKDSDTYETGLSDPMGTRTLAINSDRGPTKDIEVRQALNHALDKSMVIEGILHGTEKKADTLFAPNVPYSDLDLPPYEYDSGKAEALLEEAGWQQSDESDYRMKDEEELVLELSFDYNNHLQKAIAEFMQGEFREMGINLILLGEEEQSYLNRQKTGDFHLIFNNTWGAPYDPHSFVSSMRTPSHADYAAQAGLPMKEEIDEKISEVLTTLEEGPRQELYEDILSTLHEQAVYLPISYTTNIAAYHPHVQGVDYSPVEYEFKLEEIELK
ncbi:nickel ABC transporter substrate-binding protein [Bacillus sp. FJAT-44742]|uniref:nickel ABC transporter substrate-binding protein n=1 Tax=Bacillus sp. FJAT-44742 TaxID=2014005 RepID=UPI000C24DC9F|nr:nickel ABC transporter substrate-binding protein [Bacillus sp. FJAT-44742]